MIPYPKTHIHRAVLVLFLAVSLPLTGLATPTEEQLSGIRDEFDQLWHAAAETTKRRSSLEESLATFDTRVANARLDLERASEERKHVRERIARQRIFIEALQGQTQAADEAQAFYHAVALSQKDDFVRFLQYMVSRDIAVQESGPVAGGPLLRRVLRGSLGESIDEALARDALIRARGQFLGQVRVLVSESERVRERLLLVATELDLELRSLELEHKNIASFVEEKAGFIDDSWKVKKLTEEELGFVAQEAAEANARIAGVQASLVAINDELRESALEGFRKELALLDEKKIIVQEEKDALASREAVMRKMQAAAEEAYRTAMAQKGSDTKLYKRIQEKELEKENLQKSIVSLTALSTVSGSTVSPAEIAKLSSDLAILEQVLTYMRDGVPLEAAETYVRLRRQADSAEKELATIATSFAALNSRFALIDTEIAAKREEMDKAREQFELGDLPAIFVWPVNGVITAGYLDPDYVNVFRVPHRGMDIAVPQATPVRSVSDGVVFAVKDGGLTGYSYVLIGHRSGYASLYGHVSSMFVKPGDKVSAGQMIALSGGKPGTRGAGYMTTGAHLHLEVTKDGSHVNPLSVLPPK